MSGNASKQLYENSVVYATAGLVCVVGSFNCEATGPAVDSARGDGFTVSVASTGDYTITFAEKYPQLVSMVVTAEGLAAGGDDDVQFTLETYDATNGTILVVGSKESTGTLAPTDLDDVRCNFVAYFRKYTVMSVTHT
jgi:hypothetical protein